MHFSYSIRELQIALPVFVVLVNKFSLFLASQHALIRLHYSYMCLSFQFASQHTLTIQLEATALLRAPVSLPSLSPVALLDAPSTPRASVTLEPSC